ncbi:uncharacterized protein LOC108104266 [Drosophila eugracilis]|uniref:uncharacterized protein LOC108104266 n=1 Tax=Drosophila eugracilis TaxID=29029 RepID=UPI0007E69677|nr:uncharacterized protein LOC108104266 [Drosophila eugracilis]
MRTLCVLSLISCLGIALISTKPLKEKSHTKEHKLFNKTEIDKMMKDLLLLEKLANETYYSTNPTTRETYLSKDPTGEETKDPTLDETKDPTLEETKEPTGEETKEPTGEENQEPTGEETKEPIIQTDENGEFFVVEEDDEDEDEATVDRPTETIPKQFLRYPEHEPDFKPYPRFAILRNGYMLHTNFMNDF